uniref:Uncharacterized protein n=1 Tax=Sphaerodactylus townsendi TaxID=933632 RepID=A0ACB8EE63_9SAUR
MPSPRLVPPLRASSYFVAPGHGLRATASIQMEQLLIDALGKRSKEAEAAFLNVYKRLIDVPAKRSHFENVIENSGFADVPKKCFKRGVRNGKAAQDFVEPSRPDLMPPPLGCFSWHDMFQGAQMQSVMPALYLKEPQMAFGSEKDLTETVTEVFLSTVCRRFLGNTEADREKDFAFKKCRGPWQLGFDAADPQREASKCLQISTLILIDSVP